MAPTPTSAPLRCPHCGAPLVAAANSVGCPNHHQFDIAREGYVNLLVGAPPSRESGDSRAMLLARRAFLDGGHFDPLAAALTARAVRHLDDWPTAAPFHLLDAGCGEGFYLAWLRRALAAHAPAALLSATGMDVAKEGARLAARRDPALTIAVADVWRGLPIADQSCALLLNLFAPRNPADFARLLAPAGLLLVAIPQPDHLRALRQRLPLLGHEADKRARLLESMAPHFCLADEQPIAFDFVADGAAQAALVAMSPSARHLSAEALAALAHGPALAERARLWLMAFRPR